MKKRLAWHAARVVLLPGVLAVTSCAGDDEPDGGTPDGGARTVRRDAGSDGGVPGTGFDGGAADPCPANTEGCACDSAFVLSDVVQRDTCLDSGLVCVPWSELSGRLNQGDPGFPPAGEFREPFATCARRCAEDAQCGPGRVCAALSWPVQGFDGFCVDETTSVDNFCGFSKVRDGQHPTIPLETPGRSIGCADGHTCQLFRFGGVHPSEGICFDICQNTAECARFSDTPICNERFFRIGSDTAPQFIGVCSSTVSQLGELCGGGPDSVFGLTAGCDSSNAPANEVVCITGLVSPGFGVCWSACNDPAGLTECPVDPSGPQRCVTEGHLNLCNIDCEPFGDICAADPGSGNGLGRTCLPGEFGPTRTAVSQCAHRIGPVLRRTLMQEDGSLGPIQDQCLDPDILSSTDILRCPEPTSCQLLNSQRPFQSACLTSCRTSTAAGIPDCPGLTGSSTSGCVVPSSFPTNQNGFCVR